MCAHTLVLYNIHHFATTLSIFRYLPIDFEIIRFIIFFSFYRYISLRYSQKFISES